MLSKQRGVSVTGVMSDSGGLPFIPELKKVVVSWKWGALPFSLLLGWAFERGLQPCSHRRNDARTGDTTFSPNDNFLRTRRETFSLLTPKSPLVSVEEEDEAKRHFEILS